MKINNRFHRNKVTNAFINQLVENIKNPIPIKKPELLAPVGSFEMLYAAINAGADAIYFGSNVFSMRASAKNFHLNQLKELSNVCHKNKIKCYLTVNTIIYESELEKLDNLIKVAKESNIDAVICWDFAVINACKKYNLEFHISTQASVSNSESFDFYKQLGATRIVLARECRLEHIMQIRRKHPNTDIEAFAHGAMCVSESGRCFMSQFTTGCSANRGECLQPCRREYKITDIDGEMEFKLENNYVMSPNDLCTIEIIDKLIESGINVLKLEGRTRSPEYVDIIVRAYRKAIDSYFDKIYTDKLKSELKETLNKVYNRGFSTGFYMGVPLNQWCDTYGSKSLTKKIYVGNIINVYRKISVIEVELKSSDLHKGDTLLLIGKRFGIYKQKITQLVVDPKLGQTNLAKKGQTVGIKIDQIIPKSKEKTLINYIKPGEKIYIEKTIDKSLN